MSEAVRCVNTHVGRAVPSEILNNMKALRQQGYTNAAIARITGYHINTVLRYLGNQPREITEISFQTRAEYERIKEEKRKKYAQQVAEEEARKRAEATKKVEDYKYALEQSRALEREAKQLHTEARQIFAKGNKILQNAHDLDYVASQTRREAIEAAKYLGVEIETPYVIRSTK